MTRNEAIEFWKFKYNRAKDYKDEHWEAEERHAHHDYVNAMQMAVKALEAWDKFLNAKITEMPYDIVGRYVDGFADGIESAQKLAIILLREAESEVNNG